MGPVLAVAEAVDGMVVVVMVDGMVDGMVVVVMVVGLFFRNDLETGLSKMTRAILSCLARVSATVFCLAILI